MVHSLRLVILLVIALLSAHPVHACSLQNVGIARQPAPYFVFVASPDTASVPAWAAKEDRPPQTLSAFGQIVQITRFAEGTEPAGPDVREALKRSNGRAVLVPWGYDPSCRTVGWGRASYRWVKSSMPAFVSAQLRPRSAWANGIPTFDVHTAYLEPYPHEPWLNARHFQEPPKDRSQLLTAAEYFQLYGALPTFEAWKEAPEKSLQQIKQWLQTHPRVAKRYPANALLEEAEAEVRSAEAQAELERLRSIRPPLVGTYRLEVTVDGGASRTFYVRTRSGVSSEWTVRPGADSLKGAERIRKRDGYTIYSSGALSSEALPASCAQGQRQMGREGYLYVLEKPEVQPDGTRLWRGKIDLRLLAGQFPSDTLLKALPELDYQRYVERSRAGLRQETPARYIERPDGSVRVEEQLTFENGRTLRIEGERVSTTPIACSWW
jgi:hypothetical protein